MKTDGDSPGRGESRLCLVTLAQKCCALSSFLRKSPGGLEPGPGAVRGGQDSASSDTAQVLWDEDTVLGSQGGNVKVEEGFQECLACT